jgi:DNA-binding response OmpR family regulator
LIADDDPGLRILAAAALEAAGFEVEEAADGCEALARFESGVPDLLILDVHMPLVDGFEVCRTLRSTATGRVTPILIMTGMEDLDSIERAFEVGATDFINKPIQPALLGYRAKYLVRASRAQNEIRRLDSEEAISRSGHREMRGSIDTAALEALRGLTRNEQPVLSQVVDAYLYSAPPLLDRLRKAALAGDESEMQQATHALKSSSGNVGAYILAQLCKELEEGARKGTIADAAERVAEIEAEFESVHGALIQLDEEKG